MNDSQFEYDQRMQALHDADYMILTHPTEDIPEEYFVDLELDD